MRAMYISLVVRKAHHNTSFRPFVHCSDTDTFNKQPTVKPKHSGVVGCSMLHKERGPMYCTVHNGAHVTVTSAKRNQHRSLKKNLPTSNGICLAAGLSV